MKRFVFVCLMVLMAASLCWAGGKSESKGGVVDRPVTIRFVNWASAEDATRATIEEIIAVFESQNPGIKIENIPVPFGQISQQVVTMAAGGNPADVVQQSGWMPFELAGMNEVEDLSKWAGKDYLDSLWPSAKEAGLYQGKLIAVPWSVTPFGMWYNKDLLKGAGITSPAKTWDEFQNHLSIINNAYSDVDSFNLFTAQAPLALVHGLSWMWAMGSYPLEGGKANINTQQFRNVLSWYRKMTNEGYTTGGWRLREFREAFAQGKLAYAFDGPYLRGIMSSINREINDNTINNMYGVAEFPYGDRRAVVMDLHQLAMSSKCSDKEAAWKFIEFLTSSEISITKYILPMGAILPKETQVKGAFASAFTDPINKAFIEVVLPNAKKIPYSPEFSQAANLIAAALQRACFSNDPIPQIAIDLEREVNRVFGW